MSWYEADAYARWAGRRLPTEAEWEKAARYDPATGRSRRYPWGDEDPKPSHANLGGGTLRPSAVGSHPEGASPLGVHQLMGDVWEWVASDFKPYPGFSVFPYAEYSQVFFGGGYKVLRGGSWAVDRAACRGTFRNWDHPIRRQIFTGFRTARYATTTADQDMCRHVAFLGPPTSLAELLLIPEHGLLQQSWAPRRQRYGTVNADGFGAGWYAAGDPVPARYRRAVPMQADASFADVARVTSSVAVLAAVRSATPGTTPDESAAAPYADGKWLFSHNGRIEGWPHSTQTLVAKLPADRLLGLESRVDSALLWGLFSAKLAAGETAGNALATVVTEVSAVATGRLNFLLTDGRTITATAAGDTLFWRSGPSGTVVASEPSDDGDNWHEVPDQSLLTATANRVDVRPISVEWKERILT